MLGGASAEFGGREEVDLHEPLQRRGVRVERGRSRADAACGSKRLVPRRRCGVDDCEFSAWSRAVQHDDVQLARRGSRERLSHGRGVRLVHDDALGAGRARRFAFFRDALERLLAPRREDEVRVARRVFERDGLAQAARRSRHPDALALRRRGRGEAHGAWQEDGGDHQCRRAGYECARRAAAPLCGGPACYTGLTQTRRVETAT